ncbi:MAG: class I SAM-dependent methyltransferase, partial [Candidatus Pacebacteria bacterium]|nr:class I SAM-dependent methyltransferase [Candidatus Paceibacterota bacterium]
MLISKVKNLLRNCPVCECKKGEVLHAQSFLLAESIFLPESYDVVSCVVCGFVFADTKAKQKDYDIYYQDSSKYESGITSLGSGVTEHDHKRLEDTAKTISNFFPNKSFSILDVGSANGGLLSEMKKLNYTSLSGLDPSPACVSYMSEIGIEGVLGGLFTDNNNLYKKFDGVLLTHVLEHIYDVRVAIANVLNFLKDDGILYLEVPDSSKYKDFFISPFYFFDIEHINHFDQDSLTNLFSLFGGNILDIGQKDMPISKYGFIPAVYIVFQKNKNKANQKIKQSLVSKDSILKHIKESTVSIYSPEVDDLVISKAPVIVWGAGQA